MSSLLGGWTNFYILVATCAGTLIGLQFLVMTLLSGIRSQSTMLEVRAFGSPTVGHFCVSLLVSALMTAPWPSISPLAVTLASCGLLSLIYNARTIWHAQRSSYNPDAEEWFWYAGLPLVFYLVLTSCGALLLWYPALCVWGTSACLLGLLFNGIHNSWDTVTFIATKPSHSNTGLTNSE